MIKVINEINGKRSLEIIYHTDNFKEIARQVESIFKSNKAITYTKATEKNAENVLAAEFVLSR